MRLTMIIYFTHPNPGEEDRRIRYEPEIYPWSVEVCNTAPNSINSSYNMHIRWIKMRYAKLVTEFIVRPHIIPIMTP